MDSELKEALDWLATQLDKSDEYTERMRQAASRAKRGHSVSRPRLEVIDIEDAVRRVVTLWKEHNEEE